MKRIYILFIIILELHACVKFIETDDILWNKKLVINSIITTDSLIKVQVFQNIDINEIEDNQLVDAKIILYENEIEVENLQPKYEVTENRFYEDNGQDQFDTTYFYSSVKTTVKLGTSYMLKIKHPDYKEASCATTLPYPIQILNIDTSSTYSFNILGDSTSNMATLEERKTFNFKINFNDTKDIKNYYRLIVLYKTGILNKDTTNGNNLSYIQVSKMNPCSFKTTDPAFTSEVETANNSIFGTMSNEYKIFNDQLLEGQNYNLNIYRSEGIQMTSSYQQLLEIEPTYNIKPGEFFNFRIILQSITEDTYFYLKSFTKQYYNKDIPFVEPVSVYSNVQDGLGIFGSYSISSYEVTFGEYPIEGIEYRYK